MKHLGDITKISGYTAPIVDCIIGGSPCQDLSVAGKRAGLDGERSGLYMEQIRIVKEMRERDERNGHTGVDVRPRYMVWENVPGAFSSNKGEDFRIVLEEIAKVSDKDAVIPMPDKGKWTSCGCIMGDGWSVAWRVLDAQFWGVPQRRRRIALVADFGGHSASEILFIRQSVSGHTEQSQSKRKDSSHNASRGFGADDRIGADQYNAVILGDTVSTLGVNCGMSHGRQCVLEPQRIAYTMQDREGCEGGGKGALIQEDRPASLRTNNFQYVFQPVIDTNILDDQGGSQISVRDDGKSPTLRAEMHGNVPCVLSPNVYSIENHPNDSRVGINEDGLVQALTSRMGTGGGNVPMVMQCYSKQKRAQSATDNETWVESGTANTLNAFDVGDVRTTEAVVYQETVGALCARDYKGVGSQYVEEDKLVVAKGPGAVCYSFNPTASRDAGEYILDGVANPLINGTCPGHKSAVAYSVDCRNGTEDTINGALQSNSAHSLNGNNVVRTRYIVRRLTPLECERLQGYPDGWTDIGEWVDTNGKTRQTSDAARYKALGNSIALPPWKWVLKRLCACYERDATMASLFDGIGGFPYLWEQFNGTGSCLWASEIEEFPMAVTKVRIGGE